MVICQWLKQIVLICRARVGYSTRSSGKQN